MEARRFLKWPGSKLTLAGWILSHVPPHEVYLEPFLGSGAVFMGKSPAKTEVINDLDDRVVNLFRVIREHPRELAAALSMTPWARAEYELSYREPCPADPVEDARRMMVRCWQAHGVKLHRRTGFSAAPLPRNRGRSYAKDWEALPERVLRAASRLKRAEIENRPYEELLDRFSAPNVLVYADPPYLLPGGAPNDYYRNRMEEADHERLLDRLVAHPGPVLLSGYANPLYDRALGAWTRETTRAYAQGNREREEVLWINPTARDALGGRLFAPDAA